MTTDFKPSDREKPPQLNEIGLLAWSLMADLQFNMVGGGIPGDPGPDTPFPPGPPDEPGEPTLPDEPPPVPVA
ncbi:hypothetical protein PSCICO_05930 [Pseudomonas cichorii]|uniref:Uncharacterized protein n=1 Tax=Pseudomonas serbiensis TaxID=3064350 RepID=A0ABT9CQC4_9PSED|nr:MULTISPECIES: hypothetical protein [Pseudomonas]MDO7927690.1 hypothetical protein [Pseudomonas sp. KFB-138]GFM79746.1 hypothetical protein PSCICN_04380 [Pseudomonas cichorii]GFM85194.1 hypothetical protein PSCICO_05930 [Pseudomonas cichorii]